MCFLLLFMLVAACGPEFGVWDTQDGCTQGGDLQSVHYFVCWDKSAIVWRKCQACRDMGLGKGLCLCRRQACYEVSGSGNGKL